MICGSCSKFKVKGNENLKKIMTLDRPQTAIAGRILLKAWMFV